MGQGIKAGTAFVELGLGDKISKGLKDAQSKLKNFSRSISALGAKMAIAGAAMAAPFVKAAQTYMKLGDTYDKMSKRTGIAVETLSELAMAAEETGASIEVFEKSVQRMQRSLYDASVQGLQAPRRALEALGLTVEEVASKDAESQFYMLAEALSKVDDETTKTGIAMQLFGRAGKQLIPLMSQGAAGMDQLREKFRKAGLTMSGESAEGAADLLDKMNLLKASMQRVAYELGAAIAPHLSELADKLTKIMPQLKQWVQENGSLIWGVAKLAAGLVALGGGLSLIGGAAAGIRATVAALTFLAAHPVVAAITAVAAALGYLYITSHKAKAPVKDLAAETRRLREEGDRMRALDEKRFERLKQLADKQSLSNKETREAASLAQTLNDRYGGLGLSVDKTTGKITGLTEALRKANQAMRQKAILEVEGELAQARRGTQGSYYDESSGRWRKQIVQDKATIKALEARLAALRAGEKWATTQQTDGSLDGRINQNKQATKEQLEWERRLHRLKLEQIEDEGKRRKALADEQYDHEIEKAKAAQANAKTLLAIEAARAEELAKIDKDIAKQLADEKAAKAESIADANRARGQTVAELELEAKYEGYELEEKMLELQKKRALEAAKAAGEDLKLVEREFALRQKILEAKKAAEGARGTSALGMFNAYRLYGVGNASNAEKQLANIEKNTRSLKNIKQLAYT